jgi:hypothetical protein
MQQTGPPDVAGRPGARVLARAAGSSIIAPLSAIGTGAMQHAG